MNDGRGRVEGRHEGLDVPTAGRVEGDHDVWAAMLDALDEQQMDALLGGSALVEDLAPLAEVVQRLRQSADSEPVPPMSATLRALLDEKPPVGVARYVPGSSRHAALKAVAAAVAVALLAAGAAENRLPAGIQDVVSSSADLVGISVPRSEHRHAEGLGTKRRDDSAPDHQGATPDGAETSTPGTPGDGDPSTQPAPNEGGGTTKRPTSEKVRSTEKANPTGQANGTGVAGSHGNGSTRSSPKGQANGTGTTEAG